ncbi:nuclear transport factor 2 family protein [Phenylobacterium sp.]|uniref:YybH family protein n=1 Tax=Phenylobacterium sp. TaxID=1871053 RepID=UPI0025CBCCEB|nr:nuclear transport factor 2 family protein [Phenylobacterium sp.]
MLRLKIATGALALSFVMAGGAFAADAPAAAPAAAAPSDKAQIEGLEKGFIAAFNAKNTKKVMTYYAHQGLFVFDVTPPREYVGWAAYKKDFDDLFAAFPGPVSMKISDVSITVVGEVAYGHSIQHGDFTAKDGTKVELVVRVTDVYRKIDGKWLIVQEHVSIPVDLGTMKPDPLSKP